MVKHVEVTVIGIISIGKKCFRIDHFLETKRKNYPTWVPIRSLLCFSTTSFVQGAYEDPGDCLISNRVQPFAISVLRFSNLLSVSRD